jgi:hypothetical protein
LPLTVDVTRFHPHFRLGPEEVLHDACAKPALSLLHPGGFDPDAAPLLQKASGCSHDGG